MTGTPDSLKQEHDHLNRALRMAVAANHAIMQSTSETQLLQKVCNIAVEVGGYRMAWIGFAEQDEAKSIRPVTHAGFEKGYLESAGLTWGDSERGRGPSGTAIRTGSFVISRNIANDPSFVPWRNGAIERGFASSIALPLKVDGRTIGELAIYSGAADAFDKKEVEILQELINQLGIGIALARARHKRDLAEGRANALGVQLDAALVNSINNEILFRSIFEHAPLGIVRFDSQWRILSANAAYASLTGYSEAELLAMTIMDVTHPEDRQVTFDNRAKLGLDFKVLRHFEKRYVTKAGKTIWVRIAGKAVKIEGESEPTILATTEDITDIRELEANLELERRKALQNAKLASLGEMSAGIAHEINNPITIILGSLGLLERDRADLAKFQKTLGAVRRAGEKISRIMNGLTKFSRRSEYSQKSPRVLATLVENVSEIVVPMAKQAGVMITANLQSTSRIFCNEIEIEQVIQNLLANGIDAAKSADEKWVRVEVFDTEDGDVVLQVLDSGAGIPEGMEEKIFEPFYTTKPPGNGTGLGLSIVKGIIVHHEAALELRQVDGHTCFEIRFARMEE